MSLMNEETIQKDLAAAFPSLEGKIRITRERRIFVDVPADRFQEIFRHAVAKMGFPIPLHHHGA
jgi:hypothetical protein